MSKSRFLAASFSQFILGLAHLVRRPEAQVLNMFRRHSRRQSPEVANWEPGPTASHGAHSFEKTAKDGRLFRQIQPRSADSAMDCRLRRKESRRIQTEIRNCRRRNRSRVRLQCSHPRDRHRCEKSCRREASLKFAPLGEADGPSRARRLSSLFQSRTLRSRRWKRSPATRRSIILLRDSFRRISPSCPLQRRKDVKRNWRFPDSALSFRLLRVGQRTFLVETDLDAGNCGYMTIQTIHSQTLVLRRCGWQSQTHRFVLYLLDQGLRHDGR